MKKRITASLLVLVMLLSLSSLLAYADAESDAQAALDKIRGEQSELNSELSKGKKVESDLNKEIKALEGNIATLNLEISELGASINLTQERINNAVVQLDQVEADIAEPAEKPRRQTCGDVHERQCGIYRRPSRFKFNFGSHDKYRQSADGVRAG